MNIGGNLPPIGRLAQPHGAGWTPPTAGPAPVPTAAPQLPGSVSRYPSWQTIPFAAAPSTVARAQSAAAEAWRQLQGFVDGLKPAPSSGVLGYGANTVASTNYSIYAERVVALVNRERSIRGMPPLAVKAGLSWVSTKRSVDMIQRNYFAHVDPSGHDAYYYLRQNYIRYSTAGENIAYGQQSPEEVVTAWMNSPGHRANILNPSYKHIGVGIARAMDNQKYWTQIFSD